MESYHVTAKPPTDWRQSYPNVEDQLHSKFKEQGIEIMEIHRWSTDDTPATFDVRTSLGETELTTWLEGECAFGDVRVGELTHS